MTEALLTLWSWLFRLFPCPRPVGLRRVGDPSRDSPVLVTGNFHLTLRRLERALAGRDAWVIAASSKGVNVWCAAGAGELSTRSVVAAVKTSGVAELVDHRQLLLPPLSGPAVRAVDVEAQTGFKARWGPVRAEDLPRFLDEGRRDEAMSRASWRWRERLDTGLGTMFPFYLLGVVGFALFGPSLLVEFSLLSLATLVFFLLAAPWLPGRGGLEKALLLQLPLGALLWLAGSGLWAPPWLSPRADLVIVMASILSYGVDLGGMSATLKSEFDPMMARLGVRRAFGIDFAGTVRTDLLLGRRALGCDGDRCIGCRRCVEVCPVGVWALGASRRAEVARREACTGCTACLLQCPTGAVTLAESPEREPGPPPKKQ